MATHVLTDIDTLTKQLCELIGDLPLDLQVTALNRARAALHEAGPFANEPVDLVKWVPNTQVVGNDYNPNTVAPPEMKLLTLSIQSDGYTQPIVTHPAKDTDEVVDGFHRHRVGKEVREVRDRVQGYLPIVSIKTDRQDRSDRIAATIRHNRARGRHGVTPMSDVVSQLYAAGWDDAKIAKELGMDADEVTRLKQVTGLASLFANREYSQAWESELEGSE